MWSECSVLKKIAKLNIKDVWREDRKKNYLILLELVIIFSKLN